MPRLCFALVLLTVTLAGCTPPEGTLDREVVSAFRVSPVFNAFSGPCAIRYTLREPAYVQIRVTAETPDGRVLVQEITPERRETRGSREAAWRGTAANGLFAPQGVYVVELYVRTEGSDWQAWELTTTMYRA